MKHTTKKEQRIAELEAQISRIEAQHPNNITAADKAANVAYWTAVLVHAKNNH